MRTARVTALCLPHASRRLAAVAVAAVVLVAAGCGGSSKDKGGFTPKDRADAVDAMRGLVGTGVQSAAETFTGEMGQPGVCQIRLESRAQKRFRVFITWSPKTKSTYGYSWLEAISVDGLVVPSSLHTGTAATPKEARAHVGDANVSPTEPCRIRIDGAILPVGAG